jgi:hypothetical protein
LHSPDRLIALATTQRIADRAGSIELHIRAARRKMITSW